MPDETLDPVPTPAAGESSAPSACCADDPAPILSIRQLGVRAGGKALLRGVSLDITPRQVYGVIGPSGAGKSTLLRCLNRLVDLSPGFRVEGDVLFHGRSIYARDVDPDALRARIGMLFQQPAVFPTTIYRNVLFGVRHLGKVPRKDWPQIAERALQEASLWREVQDRLHDSALALSVGQQQRLCLARTLATAPEVILMDEPTSALDPRSTEAIEELILRLKERHTIVLVTHNVKQARRVTDWLACLCVRESVGEVVESACCDAMLGSSQCQEVIEYLSAAEG
jgi:phosphate transport system ATP-binding protein